MEKIVILCAAQQSVYNYMPDVEVFNQVKDAYSFSGENRIIAHPPCQQWSRLKNFARVNMKEKDLAFFCYEKVIENGGVFEHPAGSSFFKYIGVKPTLSVNQSWYGFPGQKRTYLLFSKCSPVQQRISFDLPVIRDVCRLSQPDRSVTTIQFADFLISSVRNF